MGFFVRFWGVRGSLPTPGWQTRRYGGNTACIEVIVDGVRYICDGGTGIRELGNALVKEADGPIKAHMFFSHPHWDHIQGFPFFRPLYDPEINLKIVGPKQRNIDVRSLFAGQMGPIYFPIPFSVVSATMAFDHLSEDTIDVGDVTLHTIGVKHPSNVVGYRIEAGGKSICFIPDDELEGDMYEVEDGWRQRLVEFIHGADLLIHDSMYTEEEYPSRLGWGHSTFSQSLRLAEEGEVKKLLFFHHDPERSDDEIDEIVNRVRDEALARGCSLEMEAAAEGLDYTP